jgi:FlgD Ig-like domain
VTRAFAAKIVASVSNRSLWEHTSKSCPAVVALALLVAGLPAAAQAADPQPLGAASGNCAGGSFGSSYSLPSTPDNHPSTIQMAHVSKAGSWGTPDIQLVGADTVWRRAGALKAGLPETGYFYCANNSGLSYVVTQYDTPTAPTSFSGSVTPGDSLGGREEFGSVLGYFAPGAAPYVADVTVAQGAIRIGDRYTGVIVASSRPVELGATNAGEHSLSLTALDGPQAVWNVAIRPLPIQVTGLALAMARARPGDVNTVRYTTNGDTRVTATVTDSAGALMRNLAAAVAVGRGDHTLTWDGADQDGRRLKDGVYSVKLHSVDPVGNQGDARVGVVIDGTPPRIVLPRSARLGRKQAIIVRLSDQGVGIRSAVLRRRGRIVARRRPGSRQIVYRPRHGYHWTPGRVRYTVTASDRVGNARTRSWAVLVQR